MFYLVFEDAASEIKSLTKVITLSGDLKADLLTGLGLLTEFDDNGELLADTDIAVLVCPSTDYVTELSNKLKDLVPFSVINDARIIPQGGVNYVDSSEVVALLKSVNRVRAVEGERDEIVFTGAEQDEFFTGAVSADATPSGVNDDDKI